MSYAKTTIHYLIATSKKSTVNRKITTVYPTVITKQSCANCWKKTATASLDQIVNLLTERFNFVTRMTQWITKRLLKTRPLVWHTWMLLHNSLHHKLNLLLRISWKTNKRQHQLSVQLMQLQVIVQIRVLVLFNKKQIQNIKNVKISCKVCIRAVSYTHLTLPTKRIV